MKDKFEISVDPIVIDDLKKRLAATRWTDEIDNKDWKYGTNEEYLKTLCSYWQNEFDWTKQEAFLNSFQHYRSEIDGVKLHFVHQKGEGPHTVPLLLTHGWPDSFVRFLKIIPLLTKINGKGFSFDVIVPSIPGFGFSDRPVTPGMNPERIAQLFARLMTEELGYEKFVAHGGDWGSSITEQISVQYPDKLLGIHLTDIPFIHLFAVPPGDLSEPEKEYLERGKKWQEREGGYAMIQSTRPQSLAYGLNDSPAGLAGWIIDKFYYWSDCNGSLENCFTKDELLTNITVYWITQTINSACRIYFEAMQAMQKAASMKFKKVEVLTGVAIFPKDLVTAPKEYADRLYNVAQWTEMRKGGHFAALEQPQLLADDITSFAASLQR